MGWPKPSAHRTRNCLKTAPDLAFKYSSMYRTFHATNTALLCATAHAYTGERRWWRWPWRVDCVTFAEQPQLGLWGRGTPLGNVSHRCLSKGVWNWRKERAWCTPGREHTTVRCDRSQWTERGTAQARTRHGVVDSACVSGQEKLETLESWMSLFPTTPWPVLEASKNKTRARGSIYARVFVQLCREGYQTDGDSTIAGCCCCGCAVCARGCCRSGRYCYAARTTTFAISQQCLSFDESMVAPLRCDQVGEEHDVSATKYFKGHSFTHQIQPRWGERPNMGGDWSCLVYENAVQKELKKQINRWRGLCSNDIERF